VIRLEEENGNERTINLRDVALGASPPAGFFAFTPPPGALVIDP
jgi:outer membrane lipoprotein-sorting protein